MPLARLARTRKAYEPTAGKVLPPWRAPHLNAAEQLARFQQQQRHEAELADCEPFDADRDPGDET